MKVVYYSAGKETIMAVRRATSYAYNMSVCANTETPEQSRREIRMQRYQTKVTSSRSRNEHHHQHIHH